MRPSRSPWPTLVLVAGLVASGWLALSTAARRHPLRRAWHATQTQSRYVLAGHSHVSAPAETQTWWVRGTGDPAGALELLLSPEDRSSEAGARAADSPTTTTTTGGMPPFPELHLRIAWPDIEANVGPATTAPSDLPRPDLSPPELDLPPRTLGALLPAGDPLLLLATGHAPKVGGLEAVPRASGHEGATAEDLTSSRNCRRVDFLVGARAYATFWHRHPGFLPVNANAGGLWKFGGQGTAWLSPTTHLPCRIVATLSLPRLVDDRPGTGEVDWVYADWRAESPGASTPTNSELRVMKPLHPHQRPATRRQ